MSSSITIYPPLRSSAPFPSGNHNTVVCTYEFLYFCVILSPFSPSPPNPLSSDSCQSLLCIYASVSILVVRLFCSLDSTYKEIIWYMSLSERLISLGIIPSRSIHAYVHCSTVYNSQALEAAQVSISRWVHKKAVVHLHNKILLGHKKEGNLAFCDSMEEVLFSSLYLIHEISR